MKYTYEQYCEAAKIKYILPNEQKAIIQNTLYEMIQHAKSNWDESNDPDDDEPMCESPRDYFDNDLTNLHESPVDDYFPKLKIDDNCLEQQSIHDAIDTYINDTIFALWAHFDAEQ